MKNRWTVDELRKMAGCEGKKWAEEEHLTNICEMLRIEIVTHSVSIQNQDTWELPAHENNRLTFGPPMVDDPPRERVELVIYQNNPNIGAPGGEKGVRAPL